VAFPSGIPNALVAARTQIKTPGHFTQIPHDVKVAKVCRKIQRLIETPNASPRLGLGQLPQVPHDGNVSATCGAFQCQIAIMSRLHAPLRGQLTQVPNDVYMTANGGTGYCIH
jgi:hypothetical protein